MKKFVVMMLNWQLYRWGVFWTRVDITTSSLGGYSQLFCSKNRLNSYMRRVEKIEISMFNGIIWNKIRLITINVYKLCV